MQKIVTTKKEPFLYIRNKIESYVERNCSVCLRHAVKVGKENVEGYKYLQIENSNSESDMYIFYNDECIITNDEVFVSFEKKI